MPRNKRDRPTEPATVTDALPGDAPVTSPAELGRDLINDPQAQADLAADIANATPESEKRVPSDPDRVPSVAELLAAHRGVEHKPRPEPEPEPEPAGPSSAPSFEELRDARLAAVVSVPAPARATFTPEVVQALNQIPKLTSLRDVEAWVEAHPDAASVCGFLPSFTRFPPDSMPSPDVMVCCDDEVMVLFTRGPDGRFSKKRLSR